MKKIQIIIPIIILMASIIITGCTATSSPASEPADGPTSEPVAADEVAKYGDTVTLEYTGTLDNGTTFDTSRGREPLVFTIGDGEWLPAFENAVLGMKVGEKKTFTIPASEAYGPYYEDYILEVPLSLIPSDIVPEIGMQLKQIQEDGTEIIATITEVSEESVTLNANHPLAGQDLTFEIELLEIL
jgi:peptidylprolyl isomerase